MDFNTHRDAINKELDGFITLLHTIIPKYSTLLKKDNLTTNELKELGDLEYFLIETNAKISEIKNILENDLFGYSLDSYYKLKKSSLSGNFEATKKLDKMRETFNESLKCGMLINWN